MKNYTKNLIITLLLLMGLSSFGIISLHAQDETRPVPVCISEATVLVPNGSVEIFAKSFDRGSFDNNTQPSDLRFTFSDVPPEQDPEYNDANKSSSRVFYFSRDTSIFITMFVWDYHNNADYCNILVNFLHDTTLNNVKGHFVHKNAAVTIDSGVDVTLENIFDPEIKKTVNTNSIYQFIVPDGTYKLSAYADNVPLIGVSTWDLIKILKNILQTGTFDNPYSYFAADVRKDGEINALDIIQLRRMILGIIDSFPQNTSWRFGDAEQQFNSVQLALKTGLKESVIFPVSQNTIIEKNLIPIKTGDVNFSSTNFNNFIGIENETETIEPEFSSIIDFSHKDKQADYSLRNGNEIVSINIDEFVVDVGQEICIPVTVNNFKDIAGFQFPVSWDKNVLTFKNIENIAPSLNNDGNVYLSSKYAKDGEIFAIWTNNSGQKTTLEDGSVLFELCFTVSQTAYLYTSLKFNSTHGFNKGVYDYLNPIPTRFNSGQLANSDGCLTYKTVKLTTKYSDVPVTVMAEDLYIGEKPEDILLVNGNTSMQFDCSNKGLNEVTLSVTHSNSEKEECSVKINVKDVVPPEAICDRNVSVTLGVDGIARVSAETFDNGSYDNCQSLFFKVIRWSDFNDDPGCTLFQEDDNPATEQIDIWYDDEAIFCCEDLVSKVIVTLRVFDKDPGEGAVNPKRMESGGDLFGRFDECLIYLDVNCKVPPILDCPPLTVNCEEDLDPDQNPDIVPNLVSLCQASLEYKDNIISESCESDIIRTWTARGCENIVQCEQHIKVEGRKPFDPCTIEFPKDLFIDANSGSQSYTEPVWDEDFCNVVTSEIMKDDTFLISGEQTKIIREWAVIDWCQYIPNSGADDNVDILKGTKLDCSKLVEDGFYRYTQIIIVKNEPAPDVVQFILPENTCVEKGDNVCIPMSVKSFKKIKTFQMSIVWDKSILNFISLELPENPLLRNFFSSYVEGNTIKIIWNSGFTQGLNLPDNTVLFKLCFTVIGEKGTVSYLKENNNDFETKVFDSNGNDLEYTFQEGKVSIFDELSSGIFNVTLNPFTCTTEIFAKDYYTGQDSIVNSFINGESSLVLNYNDIGLNCYTLSVTKENGTIENSTIQIDVKDSTPPIPVCDNNVTVALAPNGTAKVSAEYFDDGSYDNCQPVHFKVLRVDNSNNYDGGCPDLNGDDNTVTLSNDVWYDDDVSFCNDDVNRDIIVRLRVFDVNPGTGPINPNRMTLNGDLYGRYNDCYTNVEVVNKNNSLNCINEMNISIDTNEVIEITAKMLLEDNSIDNNLYFVKIFDDINRTVPQDDNIIDFSDYGNTYYAIVINAQNGNYCTTTLHIGCDKEFGLDDIQWPCNLELNVCDTINLNLSPDSLILLGASPNCIRPVITNNCGQTSVAYNDGELFVLENHYELIRYWSVFHLNYNPASPNEKIYYNVQTIKLNFNSETENYICDTLPWNTPVGDCESGHTLDDNVEWPADIVVSTFNIAPDNLKHNPHIHPNNVEPLLINNCNNNYKVLYDDEIIVTNDSFAIVNRIWTIVNDFHGKINKYTQKIKVKAKLYQGAICTYTENNYSIPEVEVYNGYLTSDDGCVTLDNVSNGTIIAPEKEDEWKAGLDLLDVITLRKYLFGIIELSPYQKIAADIDENGSIEPADLILLQKIIMGLYEPPVDQKVWKFVDADYQFPKEELVPVNYPSFIEFDTADYNQIFIGLKMGDLDNSKITGSSIFNFENTVITAQDDILNKGEYYDVDVLSTGNFDIEGIQLEFNINTENIELIDISSETIGGFSMINNVDINDDKIKLFYYKDAHQSQSSKVEEGGVLFTLKIKAKQNSILHKNIDLNPDATNILNSISDDSAFKIDLKWEDQITNLPPNFANDLDIKLYPQPAKNIVYVITDNTYSDIEYKITNAIGQKITKQKLNNGIIDVSDMSAGMYLIQFYNNNKPLLIKKMIIGK